MSITVEGSLKWLRGVCVAVAVLAFVSPAAAEKGKLAERLTPEVLAVVYPMGAERLGPEEGDPPAIPVYKGDKVVAYLFSTLDIINAPGYSTTPFDVIAGVDVEGKITGAKVVYHAEPFIVHDRIRQRQLDELLARQAGRPLKGGVDPLPPTYVAGASISSRAMRTGVLTTASLVLRARVAQATITVPTLDVDSFMMKTFEDLIAEGSIKQRRVVAREVEAELVKAGQQPDASLDWPLGTGEDLYIEILTALVTPRNIGGNLLGPLRFEEYKNSLPAGSNAIFIASNGPYDFFGTKHLLASENYRFDRVRVAQGDKTFTFVQDDYAYALPRVGQQLAGLFKLPAEFDPIKPWKLELLITTRGQMPVTMAFPLDYEVPAQYVLQPAPAPQIELPPEPEVEATWVEAWRD